MRFMKKNNFNFHSINSFVSKVMLFSHNTRLEYHNVQCLQTQTQLTIAVFLIGLLTICLGNMQSFLFLHDECLMNSDNAHKACDEAKPTSLDETTLAYFLTYFLQVNSISLFLSLAAWILYFLGTCDFQCCQKLIFLELCHFLCF